MTDPIDLLKPTPGAAVGAPPPYRLLDARAIFAPLPPVPYLVRNIGLVAGSGPPHLFAGYGYSGKTLVLQSLALSLATGRALWGAYLCGDRCRVVHVDFEQGESLTRRRYERLRRGMGVESEELQGWLELVAKPRLVLAERDRAHWRALMEGVGLIIIDALRGATPGHDENDSRIREPLDMLGDLSEETKCRAIVVHHARKPSEGAPEGGRYSVRGSSAIFDATDCAYVFSAKKGDTAIRVEHERAKSHGETVDDFALVISDEPTDDDPKGALAVRVRGAEVLRRQQEANVVARRQRVAKGDAERIRAILSKERGGVATMHLRELAGMAGERFHAAIEELGEVVETRDEQRKGHRRATVYYLREYLPDGGQRSNGSGQDHLSPASDEMPDTYRGSPAAAPGTDRSVTPTVQAVEGR